MSDDTRLRDDPKLPAPTPRWVWVFGGVILAIILTVIIVHLAGGGFHHHSPL